MKTVEEVRAFQRAWVEALKSGNFLQVEGSLEGDGTWNHDGSEWVPKGAPDTWTADDDDFERPVGYCCLGVGILVDPEGSLEEDRDYDNPDMPSGLWLSKWGISQEIANKLANMNDGNGGVPRQSFDDIGDYIGRLPLTPYAI